MGVGATGDDLLVGGSGNEVLNGLAGNDMAGGRASFAACESSRLIGVEAPGDTTTELDEGATVTLSDLSDATPICQGVALGSILNDDATLTVVGTAAAGSATRLLEGSNLLGRATAEGDGARTIAPSASSAGSHCVSATATVASGAVSPRSELATVAFDTAPSSKASTLDLLAESDSGRSNSDDITSEATPPIEGSAQAGSLITIFDGSTIVGIALAASSGKWSPTYSMLSGGAHSLASEASDAAGNVAARSAADDKAGNAASGAGQLLCGHSGANSPTGSRGDGRIIAWAAPTRWLEGRRMTYSSPVSAGTSSTDSSPARPVETV